MEDSINVSFIQLKQFNRLVLACVIISFISVSCNTPETFQSVKELNYITLVLDFFAGIILTIEATVKICTCVKENKRLSKVRSLLFDCSMVFFIWLSFCIQIAEISLGRAYIGNIPLGLFRIPRAFIMLRVLRYSNFQFESGRLTDIIVRAGHQIGGVTLFLLFFLLLYGLLGVQLFGSLYHCVKNGSDTTNVTLSSLAIPDTHCSPDDYTMCPPDFECKSLKLSIQERGYGVFDNLFVSIKTVYEAASQEGWVFLMYENIDSYRDWHSYLYFFTLIFFLAWLVKNVFIAVIIEVFAEIRVQLNNVWGSSKHSHAVSNTHVICNSSDVSSTWSVVDINQEYVKENFFDGWRKALRSRWYHMLMMVAIVLNVAITAFRPGDTELDQPFGNKTRRSFFGIAELFFTLLFDVEAIMKIICLGVRGYFQSNINRYEAFLAFMTTINTAHSFHPALRSFPVIRMIRLVKLSPTLESFLYKIFGPAEKIGMLITFTLAILTLMSTISLQMLCYVDKLDRFSTFLQAFMSMFQIMTQEGWIDVMQDAMNRVGSTTYIPISIYFILYHLFVTTVLISLFVAVILDNLELDENLKRFKQLKVNEQSVEMTRPFRLRIFEYFPNRPEMVSLSKFNGEFTLPRIRDSFLKQFSELRHPPFHTSTLQHVTGLSPQACHNFSPLFGVLASTSVAGQLALQQEGIFNLTRLHQAGKHEVQLVPEPSYRHRLKWRRSNDSEVMENCHTGSQKLTHYLKKPFAVQILMEECLRQIVTFDAFFTNALPNQSKSLLITQHVKRQETRTPHLNRRTFYDEKQQLENDVDSTDTLYNHKAQHEVDFKLIHLKRQQALLKKQRQEQELRENHPLFDTPLLIIKRDSKFRKFCKTIVTAQYRKASGDARKQGHLHDLLGLVPYLDWLMIWITIASCSSMMLETTRHRIHQVFSLQVTEYLFAISMGFELLMKVFANGLYFTPDPTFRGLGALMDLTTFFVSFLFVCSLRYEEHGNQVLFVLRCLRPLRIFKLVPQMKQVVVELLQSFKEIVMVGILLVALMFAFAIFGVQVYGGGKLASCNDVTIDNEKDCVGIFYQRVWLSNRLQLHGTDDLGFWVPRVWTCPRNFNFDSMGNAMLTLFEVLSLKGWIEVRDVIVTKMGQAHALYIHLFVFLGCMMGLTLFIGVVIANYNENKGTALLTVDQRRWEDLKSRVKIAQPLHLPKRPTGPPIRQKMYDLAENSRFKVVIACCVMVRSLLLSAKWNSAYDYAKYLVWASIALTVVFVVEIIIKTIGMTFSGMICSWRNRYDLFLTAVEVVWVFSYFLFSDQSFVYNLGWTLAALRFISICGKHATLKMLLMTVGVSVYRSFFIIAAMFLLLLCYAYAGVALFGNVKYGEHIDRHANFASAPLAVTVLFRIVTGEDWNRIMHDCMIQPPMCTASDNFWETDCGNVSAALVYFCSFYVIIAYIMLNLLVAIIVENFSLFYTMDADILFGYNDLHMFQVAWNEIDEKRKGTIPVSNVLKLFRKFNGRLAININRDRILVKQLRNEMERLGRIRNCGNGNGAKCSDDDLYVTFHDVLMMTAYRSVDIRKSLQLEELLMREKLEAEIEEDVATQTITSWLTRCIQKRKEAQELRTNCIELPDNRVNMPSKMANQTNSSLANSALMSSNENENRDNFDAPETVDNEQVDVMKRAKHRRQGLSKAHSPANPFGNPVPCVLVEGKDYDTGSCEGSEHSCVVSNSASTAIDDWWDDMIKN